MFFVCVIRIGFFKIRIWKFQVQKSVDVVVVVVVFQVVVSVEQGSRNLISNFCWC